VTNSWRRVGHASSLAVMGLLMGAMVVYTGIGAKKRTGRSSCGKWGPTIMVAIAMCLVLADTVRHVLQDQSIWLEDDPTKCHNGWWGCGGSNQYVCASMNSTCCPPEHQTGNNTCANGCHSVEKMGCLCAMGTLFTAIFTYVGFIMLAVGSMWNADLIGKLRQVGDTWKQLRGVVQ